MDGGNAAIFRQRSVKNTGCLKAGLYGDDVEWNEVVVVMGENACEGGIASI